ncbi:MAG: hypothetical protein CMJ18_14300 [Phycisphaeraceae bacterium]|nr:hypothetical protein [Phycisphaeraceae bacterium]
MTADDFSSRLTSSYRTLWLIAAGIVGDRTYAEDVVQEAALIALEKRDQYRPDSSFVAWMAQIVRFVALNHARKESRRRTRAYDPVVIDRGSASQQDGGTLELTADGQLPGDQSAFDDEVLQALEQISPIARACLLLRTIESLDYARIAQVLDIPRGTAMSHVHRSRHALRRYLTPAEPVKENV